jgi:hypothetical protein
VRIIAATIPPEFDLGDDVDAIRSLYSARLCNAHFGDALDEAIGLARERRRGFRRVPPEAGGEMLQAAGPDLTSIIERAGCGLRSPSLSPRRPSATARSATAAILTSSAFVAVCTCGPSSTSGRPQIAYIVLKQILHRIFLIAFAAGPDSTAHYRVS